jgi:tRNA(Ile)-lysidine synthase
MHKVAAAARKHGMFEPDSQVLVAVSGGPDSLCLLHSLVRLRRLLLISPVAFHFDHKLREGSELDGGYVRRQASSLSVSFVLRAAGSKPTRGQSVEAWARAARYEAMAEVLEELGGGVAALGHTADDQAETVLMALVRGGGLESISAMSPVTGSIVRPLLDVTREETVAFCRALGLRPRRDPMNEDPAYLRVALRTRAIPMIEKALGRNVRGTLARTAALLRQDAELLDGLARQAGQDVLSRSEHGIDLRTEPLRRLPAPLAGRVVRHALLELGALPETKGVEALLALASGRPGQEVSLPGGLLARRARGYLRLSRPSPRAMR